MAGPFQQIASMTPADLVIALYESGMQAEEAEKIVGFVDVQAHRYNCITCGDRLTFGDLHECWVVTKKLMQENLRVAEVSIPVVRHQGCRSDWCECGG